MDILHALDTYFNAGTPADRIKALSDLAEVYQATKSAPSPVEIKLPAADLGKLKTLVDKTNAGSVDALLSTIANNPPLLERITDFLAAPTVAPAGGLPDIIIRPCNPVTRTIARIGLSTSQVMVIFPEKHDDFRDVVKFTLGYKWDGEAWVKPVAGWSKATNAAAELGHQLLGAGFWIAPPTPDIRQMIVDESFDAEHRRKIMVRTQGDYQGWLVVWWVRSEDFYELAKRITGSRYQKPVIIVPPEHYDQVEDFASRYDFYITPAARDAIEAAKIALGAAMLMEVDLDESAPANDQVPQLGIPAEIGIVDELADDD